MNQPLLNRTSSRVAASLLGTLLAAVSAQAATIDFSATAAGGLNNWAVPGNWVGGIAPANDLTTDIARFNQTSYANSPTVGTTSIAGIIIGDGVTVTPAFNLGSSGTRLTIGASGIVMNPNAGAVTVASNFSTQVTLGANQTWTNNSANNLQISGPITGAFTLEKAGTGVLSFGGTNTFSGGLTLSAGSIRAGQNAAFGTGTLTLNGGATSSASLSNGRVIANTVVIGGNTQFGQTGLAALEFTGPVTVNGNRQISYVNQGISVKGNVTLNGNLTVSSDISSVLTVSAANLTNGLTAGGNTIAGVIADGSGSFGLIKTGTGVVHLTGANTFTGGATINAGTLSTGATGTFGADDVTLASGATITAGNSASFADTALLTFFSSSSGKINLNFSGADTIGGIYNSVSASFIGNGTYTATDLNTFFGGNVFAGAGSLTVFGAAIPEPSSFALVGGLAALSLVASRRRARR